MRAIPQAAIDLLRAFEGCSLKPYKDSGGLVTIGIGHLIKPGEEFSIITPEEAEDLLRADMRQAAISISRLITRPLSDNQYSALLCFAFNVGSGSLQRSTLRMKCNRGDDAGTAKEFLKWDKVHGRVIPGLKRRREAESALYSKV